ncbi:MAG TPA: myo-inositol-1-phosphate synthase [Thermoplasmatales archaeon]|nr:myo-inositol-1-phosphate synthase [Thermoplasmatales archaeon]
MKLWLIGAYGIVSTTTAVGGIAIEKGLVDRTGLVSELPQFNSIDDYVKLNFKFGGHEIRDLEGNFYSAALMHWEKNKHYDFNILNEVKNDLKNIKARKGTALMCGTGIEEFGEIKTLEDDELSLREIVDKIEDDMRRFKDNETVVINLASTEPVHRFNKKYHESVDGFERMIDEDEKKYASASMLYAYAAIKNGIPYGNFTPSVGSSLPALKKLALENKVPHVGNDGKTGETLIKTTLAPMFLYRNLKIVGWMGYNILGDFDGKVLSHKDNKESKIISKDSVLEKILGYSPYSITEIEYFPSLVDNKTAFDFLHFKGFLGTKMKFYFIWDGIDAIVASPIVIDIARFLLFAKKRGKYGVIKEMAFFFKSPMENRVINTHEQFYQLVSWFREML